MIFGHCLRFLNKVVDTSVVFPHQLDLTRELFVISCPNTSKRLFSIVVSFDNGDVKMVTFFFFEETVLNVPFSPLYYKFYYNLFVWIPEIPVVV